MPQPCLRPTAIPYRFVGRVMMLTPLSSGDDTNLGRGCEQNMKITNLNLEIPDNIRIYTGLVSEWFSLRDIRHWEFNGLCSRSLSIRNAPTEDLLLELLDRCRKEQS